jgi:WD40 repeat protein
MKNVNIMGIILNNFYLNELLKQKQSVRNHQLLTVVNNTEEKYKRISMISFPHCPGERVTQTRLISLWYDNTRYSNLHKLSIDVSCVEKYDENTLLMCDYYKPMIYIYDLGINAVRKVLTYEGDTGFTHWRRKQDRKIFSMIQETMDESCIIVIDAERVALINLSGHIVIVWNIASEIVVKVIDHPGLMSFSHDGKGGLYTIAKRSSAIDYHNLQDYNKLTYSLTGKTNYQEARKIHYISDSSILVEYCVLEECVLFELRENIFIKNKLIQTGQLTIRPLLISDSVFIYINRSHHYEIGAYNFKEQINELPFTVEKDDDIDIRISSYIMRGSKLITCNSDYEIRIWDIPTRHCERIICSALPCLNLIALDNAIIALSMDKRKYDYLQIWKNEELDLYPVLCMKQFIYEAIILSENILAVLMVNSLEIWNIRDNRLIRHYDEEEDHRTRIFRINRYLFACSDYYEGNGEMLYIYDYRKEACIKAINKEYVSDQLASLDDRHIAYIVSENRICIFDTKGLKEVITINLLDPDDVSTIQCLMAMSPQRLAVHSEENLYIINWQKGAIDYSIEIGGCSNIVRIDDISLLIYDNPRCEIMNTDSRVTTLVETKMAQFTQLNDYSKLLYKDDYYFNILDPIDYQKLALNDVLIMTDRADEILYNH